LHEITLTAGANTINVSAPDATGVFGVAGTDLAAGGNTINVSAPTVPAVHLTIPVGGQTINISAPTATLKVGIENRKNLVLWSEDFSQETWEKNNNGGFTGADLTYNAAVAPDGNTTATFMKEDDTGAFHNIMLLDGVNFAHDRTYVNCSVHCKPSTLQYIYISMYDFSAGSNNRNFIFQGFRLNGAGSLIDAETGLGVNAYYNDVAQNGAPHQATIEALPNGWYRISAAGFLEKPDTGGFVLEIGLGKPPVGVPGSMDAEQYFDWNGDDTSGLYIWGVQIEEFMNKTIYTKTQSAQVTNDILTFAPTTIQVSAPTATIYQNIVAGGNTINVSAPDATAVHAIVLAAGALEAPILVDNFNRTDESPATGWTAMPGLDSVASAIVGNKLTAAGSAGALTYYRADRTYDGVIDVSVLLTVGSSGDFAGPHLYQTVTSHNAWEGYGCVYLRGTDRIEVYALHPTASAAGPYIRTPVLGFVSGDKIGLRVNTYTGVISVYHNDVLVGQAYEDDFGYQGPFYAGVHFDDGASASGWSFDDFRVGEAGLTNTITLSAPDATIQVSGGGGSDLSAGANTVNVSAPDVTVHLVIPAGGNTINISAPAQSLIVEITLQAGQNTINVSAPAQGQLVQITLAAGANTVNVSAPEETLLAEITLAAGANTINVSAPAQTMHLLIPAGLVQISISAPDADITVDGGPVVRNAGANTINVSAPEITTHLTIPAGLNQINVSAPEETLFAEVTLTAGGVTINLSAPTATGIFGAGETSLSAGGNTINLSAPLVTMHLLIPAGGATISVSAPTAVIQNTFDTEVEAGTVTIRVYVPIITLKQTFPGAITRQAHDAWVAHLIADAAEFARETNHEARSARNVEDTQVVITT
jgi:hypothetical protein